MKLFITFCSFLQIFLLLLDIIYVHGRPSRGINKPSLVQSKKDLHHTNRDLVYPFIGWGVKNRNDDSSLSPPGDPSEKISQSIADVKNSVSFTSYIGVSLQLKKKNKNK